MLRKYFEYIKNNPEHYWFKRKLYGWGWTPATKEGWLVMGVFFAGVLQASSMLPNEPTTHEALWFLAKLFLYVAGIILVCFITGEKPMWQWGIPKEEKPNS